jgi:TPR repeat protein
MTMRAWGVIALVVTTTIALLAGMLTLGPFGIPDSSFDLRDQPRPSPGRAGQAPMIIAAATIDVEPSSHTPLLIEIGPPEWVPRDSTLQIQGLPSSVTLSQGRRVSSKLWAVPITALSRARIDVAADAAAGQSDVTLTLVGSDGRHITEAHTAIAIDALTSDAANAAAKDASGLVSRKGPDVAPPRSPAEVSPSDHATTGRMASGPPAKSAEAPRLTPGAPSDQLTSGRKVAPAAQHAQVVASSDLATPSGETTGLARMKDRSETLARSSAQSARPEQEEIATQREGGSAAPAGKQPAPAPKEPAPVAERETFVASREPARPSTVAGAAPAKSDAQGPRPAREEVPVQHEGKGVSAPPPKEPGAVAHSEALTSAEPAKPSSTVSSEPAGVAGAKGGSTKPVTSEAQSVQPIMGEEIASQRTFKGAAPQPADKDAASAHKDMQREAVTPAREPAKSPIGVSEANGPAKGGPATPAKSEPQATHPVQNEQIAAQPEVKGSAAAIADKEVAPSPKGPGVVAHREAVVAAPEPVKPSAAASETTGLVAGAKGGPAPPAKSTSEAQSAHPIQTQQIAAQPEVKGAAAAPADKEAAPLPKGPGVVAQREAVLASPEPTKANETTGLTGAKGGPAPPAKSEVQSPHPVKEQIAAQPEVKDAAAAPVDKEAAPSPKGPGVVAQRETVVGPPEPVKPSAAASETTGLAGAKGGPAPPAKSEAQSAHPVRRELIAAQPEVKGAAAAPADKEAAPSPKGPGVVAQREEPVKPSTAAGEAAELAGAKGGSTTPAKSEVQRANPVQREQIAAQPEAKSSVAADKPVAPSPKGPAVMPQREAVVASPEPTKANETTGLAAPKGGPATPAKSDGQSARPVESEQIAARPEVKSPAAAVADQETAPSPKGPAVVARAVGSPEPGKPATAASETTGLAAAKGGPPALATSDARSTHPIQGEEVAMQRELKSAYAAPAGADAPPAKGDGLASQEGERFVARGEDSLAAGNVAVAREFFLRAADAGVARGALMLASTYDPYELVGLHVVGVQPNTALAQRWYERAEALGEKLASERIARLERR